MSLAALVTGSALARHRVSAQMPEDTTENKIHEDGLARDFGFRGGLVPGVTVYAWMTHPVVSALGAAWLDRGTFGVRFKNPVYFDEPIEIEAAVAERSDAALAIEARAMNGAGEVCATATFGLAEGVPAVPPDRRGYPAAPLPLADERPRVSREVLAAQPVLGTPELVLDASTAQGFLGRVAEPLALYRGSGAPAHPGLYLHEANRALSRNVVVSPWIHVESEGRHLGPFRVGERLETRARVGTLFERKGHQFVELDLLLLAEGVRPVAHIRHKAIYELRGPGAAKVDAR
jgi:acyl dehydratase